MRKKLKDVCMFYSGTGFPIQYQGQTKEGDILDELRAIVEDMEEGNIDKLKIEREA